MLTESWVEGKSVEEKDAQPTEIIGTCYWLLDITWNQIHQKVTENVSKVTDSFTDVSYDPKDSFIEKLLLSQ